MRTGMISLVLLIFIQVCLQAPCQGDLTQVDPQIKWPPDNTDVKNETLEEYDESLSEFIREILENFRDQMKDGIPEIDVPPVDPLVIPNIDENIDDGIAKLLLRMHQLTITGISKFRIDVLKADLERGFANISLYLPKLRANGYCYMDGKILGIFPLNSDGDFFIEVEEVIIEGYGNLNITRGEKVSLHMNNLQLSLSFGSLKIEFKSLLGGGKWTQMLIKLLTGLGGTLFQHFHQEAMSELNKVLLKVVNKELDKGTLDELLQQIPLLYSPSNLSVGTALKNNLLSHLENKLR